MRRISGLQSTSDEYFDVCQVKLLAIMSDNCLISCAVPSSVCVTMSTEFSFSSKELEWPFASEIRWSTRSMSSLPAFRPRSTAKAYISSSSFWVKGPMAMVEWGNRDVWIQDTRDVSKSANIRKDSKNEGKVWLLESSGENWIFKITVTSRPRMLLIERFPHFMENL